ncbi:MAG: hypothetical protein R6U66_07915 [Bacteroidales bacterium]
MNSKITKRDITFFIFGFLAFIAIEVISNWEEHKKTLIVGWEDTSSEQIIEN